MTIEESLAAALAHYQARELPQAEEICRQVLERTPDHADALQLLGLAAHQAGRHEFAVECIQRAIRADARQAHFHNNLGEVYRRLGRIPEAVACFRRALELTPDDAETWGNLACALADQGDVAQAIACRQRAIQTNPADADAHNDLGAAFFQQGQLNEAIACFQRAVALRPDHAGAYYNMGTVRYHQGRLHEAIACYRRAVELMPDLAEGHNDLGTLWHRQGNRDEAIACFRRAAELKPDYAEPYRHLGAVWHDLGRMDEAVACYLRAGIALRDQGRLDEAIGCCRRALEIRPDSAEGHYALGLAWCHQGDAQEAMACYRRALELKPDWAQVHSSLLSMLQYRARVTLGDLRDAHAQYERQHAAPWRAAWRENDNSRDPERPLRLGFVSADFARHPVGYFLVRTLENLDRRRCEVVCYSDRLVADDMTGRFQAAATAWRDASQTSDEQLTQQIRADRIDILFDLAGHTAKNRLLVFARKPSPIQITWMGYAGTTGLAAMDYILADRWEIPPESEPHYCEHVLRMPHGYISFDPPDYAPSVQPLPALATRRVTFGSFNHPAKITPAVVACWADILGRVPQSRLLLKHRGLDDPVAEGRLRKLLAERGVAAQRVELLGWSPHDVLLGCYNQVDVALDTFPYNGGLTTCEALWMGVPVVTFPGETFAGRHSLSHLSNVGLTETISRSTEEYVDLAARLAEDLPRLAALRAGLRHRVALSPLCDGRRFAEDLMHVLRHVWREWAMARQ